ncbi:MAG: glycosyltransferase family 1 protein, partial [Arcobacter sp.]|nr:glycosyltransferase family 1 protein [Arcobacter sp.]
LYIARDNKEDNRCKFAKLLNDFSKKENLKLKMYGSLGNPLVFGSKYYDEISKSRIAINFNREDNLETFNKTKILGTSDRMNHFMGTGTCTFSPKILDLDKLYKGNEHVVYFENTEDCFRKIKEILLNKNYEKIGQNGRKRSYSISNAKRITKFILELGSNQKTVENYEWKEYIFKNGKRITI